MEKFKFLGANPTQIAACGRTAIGIACHKKHVNVLELLLNACKNSRNYDSGESEAKKWKWQNRDGNSDHTPDGMNDLQWDDEIEQPLPAVKVDTVDDEWSVLYRYYARIIETTSDLLANAISMHDPHCLDAHCLDAYQEAPLHYTAQVGSYECMELLLKHKAPINATMPNGLTALHLAVEQPNLVELLLQYKANPNKLTCVDQMAPIHLAVAKSTDPFGAVDTVWNSFLKYI